MTTEQVRANHLREMAQIMEQAKVIQRHAIAAKDEHRVKLNQTEAQVSGVEAAYQQSVSWFGGGQ